MNGKIITAVGSVLFLSLVGGGLWYWQNKAPDDISVAVDQVTWQANLVIEPLAVTEIKGETIYSSTKLSAEWDAPEEREVDHYVIEVIDGVMGTKTQATVEGSTQAELVGLKSETEYTINVTACMDAACENQRSGDLSAKASTSAEYWQIQGTGSGYESATQATSTGMGSTLAYVLAYGTWAPKDLQGTVKLYSSGNTAEYGLGMHIGVNESGLDDVESLDEFEDVGVFYEKDCNNVPKGQTPGNNTPTSGMSECPKEALQMLAFQMVPLTSGDVRVYFEAELDTGEGKPTVSIYSLDSQDGYAAEDFNPSNSDHCATTDMVEGGDCEPTPLIGLAKDGESSVLTQARQNKIGYPKQDSWLWDESEGTFMVVTAEDACGQTRDGLFYGVWSGTEWEIELDDEGCAKPMVLDAHGPVIVHLGETNYKLYYENYDYANREDAENLHYQLKPTRVLYASGASTGDESLVEFEDWENEADAREVYFLWPDGTQLNDQEEAGLGDHVIWSPNENLDIQIMYMNLGGFDNKDWKQGSAGVGMAVLVNP